VGAVVTKSSAASISILPARPGRGHGHAAIGVICTEGEEITSRRVCQDGGQEPSGRETVLPGHAFVPPSSTGLFANSVEPHHDASLPVTIARPRCGSMSVRAFVVRVDFWQQMGERRAHERGGQPNAPFDVHVAPTSWDIVHSISFNHEKPRRDRRISCLFTFHTRVIYPGAVACPKTSPIP
jgi:hypothetical protein